MNRKLTSAVIVVDDDADDLELVSAVHEELHVPNPLVLLGSPTALIEYLNGDITPPFLILCDFNLPIMNGLELRRQLIADQENRFISIPFLLWSTGAANVQVQAAFSTEVQGFFIKPTTYTGLMKTYSAMINYWQLSLHPKPIG